MKIRLSGSEHFGNNWLIINQFLIVQLMLGKARSFGSCAKYVGYYVVVAYQMVSCLKKKAFIKI